MRTTPSVESFSGIQDFENACPAWMSYYGKVDILSLGP